ncbi:hypothetical protein ACAG26_26015 [Mycobacterium sp. pUA109]|uniref:hypothetical protein n=1 Tax=Mycobacterium sp. pUA109 TaxID=3238982 RepID=UPI00351BDF68
MFGRFVALAALGVAAAAPLSFAPAKPALPAWVDVLLAADETALILGPSGTATPNQTYIDTVVNNYLSPEGYTGGDAGASALTTPEQFSGASYTQGEADVIEKLVELQQSGALSSADPTYLFGYSQSATILSAVDSNLHNPQWVESVLTSPNLGGAALSPAQAAADAQTLTQIDPSDLHLVLVGDPAADPGDGILPGFDNAAFTQSWLQDFGFPEMMGVNSNADLSPTDVFTLDGDNWAQAQSLLGIPDLSSWQHLAYLGLEASNFTPVATDGLTDYFNAADDSVNALTALWDALLASL